MDSLHGRSVECRSPARRTVCPSDHTVTRVRPRTSEQRQWIEGDAPYRGTCPDAPARMLTMRPAASSAAGGRKPCVRAEARARRAPVDSLTMTTASASSPLTMPPTTSASIVHIALSGVASRVSPSGMSACASRQDGGAATGVLLTRSCHHIWQPPGNCRRPVATAKDRAVRRVADLRRMSRPKIAGHRIELRTGNKIANRSLRAIDSSLLLIGAIVRLTCAFVRSLLPRAGLARGC